MGNDMVLSPLSFFDFVSADPEPQLVNDLSIFWIIPRIEARQSEVLRYRVNLNPAIPLGTNIPGAVWAGASGGAVKASTEWANHQQGLACKFDTPECATLLFQCAIPGCHPLSNLSVCAACPTTWDNCTKNCDPSGIFPQEEPPARNWFVAIAKAVAPIDPNEKIVAARQFIQPDQLLVYPIHFENIGDIEAQDVFITDVLDPNLDISTLQIIHPEDGVFDLATRTLQWNLLGINLPPGESGDVLFSIKPLQGLPSGTEIRNSAKIQFEVFAPLITAEVVNVIDAIRPNCQMAQLPAEILTSDFLISWSSTDSVGEIDYQSVFVSIDGGGFAPFLVATRDTDAMFHGELGKTYEFLCAAKDTAGNLEIQEPIAEAVTTVVGFAFTGFFAPVENRPIMNSVKAGRAVPIKFSLAGDKGLDIFVAGSPNSQKITCDTGATLSDVEETITTGKSNLHYDASDDQYVYVWKTDDAWAGTCRQFTMELKDGSVHKADFVFE